MLLEAITDLLSYPPPWAFLPLGAHLTHQLRGPGTLLASSLSGGCLVKFADGKQHNYHADSMHKFEYNINDCNHPPQLDSRSLVWRALLLCVMWDTPELVHKVLSKLNERPPAGMGCLPQVHIALQQALELQRTRMVRALLKLPGLSFSKVDMCHLYTKCDNPLVVSSRAFQFQLKIHNKLSLRGLSDGQHYRFYQYALDLIFKTIHPSLYCLLISYSSTQAHDIFFWLTLQGNMDMAKLLWPMCSTPVHIALLAAAIAFAEVEALPSGPMAAAAMERAVTLEQWACGAIQKAETLEEALQVRDVTTGGNRDRMGRGMVRDGMGG